ncbi:glucose inhibited division protein a homologue [Plasmodium gonderi]|uniref:Glucose inhibited division protein a homologue n=1 Tax=Plasmodium gonderi TaxID=77519 RepID=A0A1Y1JV72_PLAGO|nr:glucose inhibited division protein a homologue [Plasmodium gonderi]GAW83804.1 glucose inhibited division protein a homologue [Plasmodium gonderi]
MSLNLYHLRIITRALCYIVILLIIQQTPTSKTYLLEKKKLSLQPPRVQKRTPSRRGTCRNSNNRINLINEKCKCKYLDKNYDVIVIGGGHSGCESSYISTKLKAKTLLVTQCKDNIGEMSCNPSIGGIGKGILVKEIDALGGLMAKVIDKSGIHFKILNLRKGLAVRGHRAQADRDLYNYYMKEYMFNTENLYILENTVQSLLIEDSLGSATSATSDTSGTSSDSRAPRGRRVYGIRNKCCCEFYAKSVILTTGTFLGGICHIGKNTYHGGRIKRISLFNETQCMDGTQKKENKSTSVEEEKKKSAINKWNNVHGNRIFDMNHINIQKEFNNNSIFDKLVETSTQSISNQLKENNFEIKRMKTGTPPRLHINSINFDILEKEDSEKKNPFYFSFLNSNQINNNKTLPCYKTYTNLKTHELVKKYLNELPDFDSYDKLGNGPRYCPSIAKKVTKFSEKNKHIIWLEPEGFHNSLIYPNGLSSAFPIHIQKQIINSIKGLENAKIIFPAYDVEYYYVNPQSLNYTLETKYIKGLFLAGQICGTTGYEEAACQGIVAGINAALLSLSKNEKRSNQFILKRNESYIGVLIHDLINKGVTEPYRIFTSRAEYRLYLRPDNCDIRLTPKAHKLGIVSDERIYIMKQKYASINRIIFLFKNLQLDNVRAGEEENTKMQTEECKPKLKTEECKPKLKTEECKPILKTEECKPRLKTEVDYPTNTDHTMDSKDSANLATLNDNSCITTYGESIHTQNGKTLEGQLQNDRTRNEKDVSDKFVKNSIRAFEQVCKDNIKLKFTSRKGNINTLYNILRSGVEYPLDVLLNKLREIKHWDELDNTYLPEQNNLTIYMDKIQDYHLAHFKIDDLIINMATLETACAEVKYFSYLKKQIREINKIKDNFDLSIPPNLKYDRQNFPYLSNEEIEKLDKFKPRTLSEANRIEGVTMSAIYYLYYYIKNEKKRVKN